MESEQSKMCESVKHYRTNAKVAKVYQWMTVNYTTGNVNYSHVTPVKLSFFGARCRFIS